MGSIIRSTGTVFYSLLFLNSRRGFNGLKYMYSVTSVIVDSLPGNAKNRGSTRSWTARVRLVHPWAEPLSCWHFCTHCNTLHTATHCNTLQHTATHYNINVYSQKMACADNRCRAGIWDVWGPHVLAEFLKSQLMTAHDTKNGYRHDFEGLAGNLRSTCIGGISQKVSSPLHVLNKTNTVGDFWEIVGKCEVHAQLRNFSKVSTPVQ